MKSCSQSTGDFLSYWRVFSEGCWNLAYISESSLCVLLDLRAAGMKGRSVNQGGEADGSEQSFSDYHAHESRGSRIVVTCGLTWEGGAGSSVFLTSSLKPMPLVQGSRLEQQLLPRRWQPWDTGTCELCCGGRSCSKARTC